MYPGCGLLLMLALALMFLAAAKERYGWLAILFLIVCLILWRGIIPVSHSRVFIKDSFNNINVRLNPDSKQ